MTRQEWQVLKAANGFKQGFRVSDVKFFMDVEISTRHIERILTKHFTKIKKGCDVYFSKLKG